MRTADTIIFTFTDTKVEEKISDPEAKDINLGLIQVVISKCCYASDRVAITAAIVIAIAITLLDRF